MHLLSSQLSTTGKGRQVISNGFRGMMRGDTDLAHSLACQGQPYILNPVTEHRSHVLDSAAQRYMKSWIDSAQQGQSARDRSGDDKGDSVGQVLACQEKTVTDS